VELAVEDGRGLPLAGRPVSVLHIMKTGGTSLVAGLRALAEPRPCVTEIFLDEFVSLPRERLERAALVSGHLPYEAQQLLPPGFAVCVVLRDPVDRTLSHFAEVRRNPEVVAESPDFSLEEFLESPRWRTLYENYQARQLAHEVQLDRAGVDYVPAERFARLGPPFPREHPLPLQSYFDCSPLASNPDELLRRGRERLDELEFVGVTEKLENVFTAVARSWGVLDPSPLPRLQVSGDRPRANDLPDSILERIRDATAVDRALYERARELASDHSGVVADLEPSS
jgi:hypothetical protein